MGRWLQRSGLHSHSDGTRLLVVGGPSWRNPDIRDFVSYDNYVVAYSLATKDEQVYVRHTSFSWTTDACIDSHVVEVS